MTQRASEDVAGGASLTGHGLAGVTALIRDSQAAVAGRVFPLLGPVARPVQIVYDGIASGVYAAVGSGTRAVAAAGGAVGGVVADRRTDGRVYVPFADTIRGGVVTGALNGAWGDTLAKTRNPLALTMTVRADGRDVPLEPAALARAFPEASDDVVVFLHGLCETELAWWLDAQGHYGNRRSSHGARLTEEIGATPVYLRYNSGLHISDNGAALDTLLAGLVAAWPTAVTRLTLVGHSMGGLVIRAACTRHVPAESEWLGLVRRIVYLGAPHLGAPLEVVVSKAGRVLRRFPETRPVATALASRSVGIKDLRFGDIAAIDPEALPAIADPEDWRPEPDDLAPLLPDAEHYYIGVTVTRDKEHAVARLVGDALVTFPSASGAGPRRRLDFEVDRGRHLGGLHHFDLLNHPRVWEQLRTWLATD